MALITCQKCGNMISDQADKCPRCGHPAGVPVFFPDNPVPVIEKHQLENDIETQEVPKKTIFSKKIVLTSAIAVAALSIALIVLSLFTNKLNIKNIELRKWELTEENSYFDVYRGTVESDEEKPFIAVIGYYDGKREGAAPKLIYMENGRGTMSDIITFADEPTTIFRPLGYMSGKAETDSIVRDITCFDRGYYDYETLGETSCDCDLEIKMKNKKSGILFFEYKNDLSNGTEYGEIVVIDGIGKGTVSLSDLPLKSRGVDVTVIPKYFCSADKLKDKDYVLEKEFSIKKGDTNYSGSMELYFPDYKEGIVIYTRELLSGGESSEQGKVVFCSTTVQNGECEIATSDYFGSKSMLTPQYEINIVGCIPWTKLK